MDGENCLDGETSIQTDIGELTIKEICENDLKVSVLSKDIFEDRIEYQPIEKTFISSKPKEWFEIEMEDGTVLKITAEHKVYLPKLSCYRRVKDLVVGDEFDITE